MWSIQKISACLDAVERCGRCVTQALGSEPPEAIERYVELVAALPSSHRAALLPLIGNLHWWVYVAEHVLEDHLKSIGDWSDEAIVKCPLPETKIGAFRHVWLPLLQRLAATEAQARVDYGHRVFHALQTLLCSTEHEQDQSRRITGNVHLASNLAERLEEQIAVFNHLREWKPDILDRLPEDAREKLADLPTTTDWLQDVMEEAASRWNEDPPKNPERVGLEELESLTEGPFYTGDASDALAQCLLFPEEPSHDFFYLRTQAEREAHEVRYLLREAFRNLGAAVTADLAASGSALSVVGEISYSEASWREAAKRCRNLLDDDQVWDALGRPALFRPRQWKNNASTLVPLLLERPDRLNRRMRGLLGEIHRAYVLGLWKATISLCRAFLEAAIAERAPALGIEPNWPADTSTRRISGTPKNLKTLIEELNEKLPDITDHCELIRRRGNEVLHWSKSPSFSDKRSNVVEVDFRLQGHARECIDALRHVLERLFSRRSN